jgi:hypothetical protein
MFLDALPDLQALMLDEAWSSLLEPAYSYFGKVMLAGTILDFIGRLSKRCLGEWACQSERLSLTMTVKSWFLCVF